ncbi:MAG: hypothetical protein WBW61_09935 [Rhodanobacteraceae bacterium]
MTAQTQAPGFFDRVRRNASDAWSLFAFPLLVALLPWRVGFRLLRRIARGQGARLTGVESAWHAAQPFLPAADEQSWKHHFQLLRLVERVDTWLTLLRSERWWRRRIRVEGAWPPAGQPCVLLTYHWGAGHWVWMPLRGHGIDAYFVARRPQATDLGASRVALFYGRLRKRALVRIGSLGPLFVGGSAEHMSEALNAGRSLVGMLDLPVRAGQQAVRAPLLGGKAQFPTGLARVAERNGVRVALFSCGLDFTTGLRDLRIETLPLGTATAQVLERYAQHLDRRLRESPEAWHLWSQAAMMFASSNEP